MKSYELVFHILFRKKATTYCELPFIISWKKCHFRPFLQEFSIEGLHSYFLVYSWFLNFCKKGEPKYIISFISFHIKEVKLVMASLKTKNAEYNSHIKSLKLNQHYSSRVSCNNGNKRDST